jgi:hypothetical protein
MMRKEYDFRGARRNPFAARLRRPVTIRLEETTLAYFRRLAEEVDLPYQTLINLYLRDCATNEKRLRWSRKTRRRGRTAPSPSRERASRRG